MPIFRLTKNAIEPLSERITLKPVNSDFKPIVLTGADEGSCR